MEKISLAFSPCPNDIFIMYAVMNGLIDTGNIVFDIHIDDVEMLNKQALNNTHDISKVSSALLSFLFENYNILDAGAAFGKDGGPLLIKSSDDLLTDILEIAIPGEFTSANLLLKKYYSQKYQERFVLFSDIFELLKQKQVDAGVVIHEDRFTYASQGFVCMKDLGELWLKEYSLPVPLGVFVVSKRLKNDVSERINSILVESIKYSWNNFEQAVNFTKAYSQSKNDEVIISHIKAYVNELSLSLENTGIDSLSRYLEIQGNYLLLQNFSKLYSINAL